MLKVTYYSKSVQDEIDAEDIEKISPGPYFDEYGQLLVFTGEEFIVVSDGEIETPTTLWKAEMK